MQVTLDQARALDALAREGTFAKAAAALGKAHTAVLYALRGLEQQTGLALLDRSGWRTRITPAGERVLEHCRRLLQAEADLAAACAEVRTGWEPAVRVVLDGIFPAEPLLRAIGGLTDEGCPTRFDALVEFLTGVEAAFERERADLMVSLLPPSLPGLRALALPPVRARLVVRRGHPLARLKGPLHGSDLARHVLVTVRGSDPRLRLVTEPLEQRSTVRLSDFAAKRAAILAGLGFGWLPDHMAAGDLKAGRLVALVVDGRREHVFEPRLYHRASAPLGRAARRLCNALGATPETEPAVKLAVP